MQLHRLHRLKAGPTNSIIKFKSVNPNISCSHYNAGKYVVSECLFSLKLKNCLTPLVEQRIKPTLTFTAMTQNRALVKCVRKNRITFFRLAAGKYVYCLTKYCRCYILQRTSRYINTVISTCQVLLQRQGSAFCNYWWNTRNHWFSVFPW